MAEIERRIRAFDPFPGCSARLGGEAVKVWRAKVVSGAGAPGERLPAPPDRLVVACGQDALELLQLQLPGGRRIGAPEYLRRLPATRA